MKIARKLTIIALLSAWPVIYIGCQISPQLAQDEAAARVILQDIDAAASSNQAPSVIKAGTARLRAADPGSPFVQRSADKIDAAVDKGDLNTIHQITATGLALLNVIAPVSSQ